MYIIRSKKNNKYYVGCTGNFERRLLEHNLGLSKYTRNGRPWIKVYVEEFNSFSKARTRENQIKGWKKRSAIEKLIISFLDKPNSV